MNDLRKGLPLDHAATVLNQITEQHCSDDIKAALKKYNCSLIFQQVHRNGMPAEPGQYVVVRNQEQPKVPE